MVLGYSCKKHLFFGCILALNNSLWASVNHAQSTESSGGQSHIEKYWSICSIRPAFNNQISTDRQTLERYAYHSTLLKQNLWNFFIKGFYKRSLFLHLDSTLLLYWFVLTNKRSSPLHIWVFCIHNRFIFIHFRNIWYICIGIHRYIFV